jgi:DNA helicase-2/ATP-dependent DNA helicase PcrA
MSKLTAQQMEVVTHDGHLLVVAGPGSGKTTTSVAKGRRILKDPNRSLVMVTFTKEGAEEIRKRLQRSLEAAGLPTPGENRLLVATFHSIALKHLKRNGLSKRLLGPREQDILYSEAAEVCQVETKDWSDVQHDFERIMYAIEPDKVEVSAKARAVAQRYCDLREKSGQVDLYTIMRDCALGVANGSLPTLPYTDMLVDEGQDTDELQSLWIFAHARAKCTVTIVGDDDQSIYEWRNALGYKGMRAFLDEFDAKVVDLGDNFRCRSEILTPAATLISRNRQRLAKHLVAKRGSGGSIIAFNAGTAQNRMLAGLIEAVPQKHTNAAVLARYNRSLDEVEFALRELGISYTRLGPSIWDSPAVTGYLGLLQSLVEATPSGLLSLLKQRQVDPQTRQELMDVGRGHAAAFLDGDVPDLDHTTPVDHRLLKEIANDLSYWRRQLRAGSVQEVVIDVSRSTAKLLRSEHQARVVELCGDILSRMTGTLSMRLQIVSRRTRNTEAQLTLMTMHAAKGLEFETVHIVDANKVDDATLVHEEAERRLMYVALTRAKNACVVWFSGAPHPTIMEADLSPEGNQASLQAALERSG